MASPSNVPYLAYKSKRHSRTLSNSNSHLLPNQSPPPISRPSSSSNGVVLQSPKLHLGGELDTNDSLDLTASAPRNLKSQLTTPPSLYEYPTENTLPSGSPIAEPSSSVPSTASSPNTAETLDLTGSPRSQLTPMKSSTFRRLPLRKARPSRTLGDQVPMHSQNASVSSLHPRSDKGSNDAGSKPVVLPSVAPVSLPSIKAGVTANNPDAPSLNAHHAAIPPPISKSSSMNHAPNWDISDKPLLPVSSPPTSRKPAPYPPGFQPKGVCRVLTDDFLSARRMKRESEGEGGMKRVERTKLERRLEKLINLHFPLQIDSEGARDGLLDEKTRPGRSGRENHRASSIFDLQTLKNVNFNDASGLWRGVVSGGLRDTTKMEIRAAEQRITPWEDDAAVSKCPLCAASFHPLTNRKHHCRLCGQIICSLPIKHPHRTALCSILFVVDIQTRQVEEVGEGVDYGVRKRKTTNVPTQQARQEEEDKFLKGVRICRNCRPILLRHQYEQQIQVVPPFVNLYKNFIDLEMEIEESLPKFQELILNLNHNDQPTKEASAARKRLLDSFAHYDKVSKKIRGLQCPSGAGSSQDRVQMAIMTRANLFLQKNMFPLQSLPTPRSSTSNSATSKSLRAATGTDASNLFVDMDSVQAKQLQPLLEQETLLESFIEEAQAQRKFEDLKALKINLAEIRQEIERLLAEASLPKRRSNV
ncbi:hypothetical protein BYT27DRAFT_7228531 [Phlegmacium glaucopus]|nr:hypothetical protein BYT27DRAFT_7228531 [Phlegmacium glaucopus]